MNCRKMDYFAFLLAKQAKLMQLSAEHSSIKQGVRPVASSVRPVASRIGLIVEKAKLSAGEPNVQPH
jgi:hypothetical protein